MSDYRDFHKAPFNEGTLGEFMASGKPKEEYFGSCRLTDFFDGYPAYGQPKSELKNMDYQWEYDKGMSFKILESVERRYQFYKDFGKAKGQKIPEVTVYRTVPNNVTDDKINDGDWVTLSLPYARVHGDHRYTDNYHIIEAQIPIDQIWWDGQHIAEFGVDRTPVVQKSQTKQTVLDEAMAAAKAKKQIHDANREQKNNKNNRTER